MPARRLPANLRAASIDQARRRAEQYLHRSKAHNTVLAYGKDWRDFVDWCDEREREPLPALPETVALYLADLAVSHKYSTIRRRLTSISQAHAAQRLASPGKDPLVRGVLDGIKREIGFLQRGKTPLLTSDVLEMVDALPTDLKGLRDRALILIGFAGCFRRSELVKLTMDEVDFRSEGVVFLILGSKTDQSGEGLKKAIPFGTGAESCPVRALRTWLDAARIASGPLFRRVDRHGNLGDAPLSSQSVALVVKAAAMAAGLDPRRYAGHSLRSGLATQAAISGASERSIMAQGAWHSEKMARRYIRDATLFRDNAAGRVGL
jgi:site-specific recombinase XerD